MSRATSYTSNSTRKGRTCLTPRLASPSRELARTAL
jgi:hypothetical protein